MFTPWLTLLRCLCSFFIVLVPSSFLFAQQPAAKGIGRATKPHTVVYKLKAQPGAQLRMATGQNSLLQSALQQTGASSVQQKFPGKSPSPNARRGAVDLSLIYELSYSPDYSFEDVRRMLMATGMVAYVEPLYQREPFYQPNDPSSDSTKTTQIYLKRIQAYSGWAVEKGDTNIVIGILDTGFRMTHDDLKRKIKLNYDDPIDGIDNDGDGLIDNYYGWDFGDRDNNPEDDSPYRGHGVAVTGVAAAESDNGLGISGVGFNTKFMAFKVFPSTQTGSFAGYEAIVHAADKGCSIINLSWGGEGFSQFEQDVINYAVINRDVVVVAAAGNTNAFVNIYPAAYDNVLSVGGVTSSDVKTSGHTWNYNIDLTAQSASVYTTTMDRDNSYGNRNGTSYAAPQVAGAAALVRSRHPHLNALQVMQRLRVTTDDNYHLAGNALYFEMIGKGRLNLKRALKANKVKSVRCTAFEIAGNQVAQIGDTISVNINLTNYLDPLTALQVKLTSASPYVRIVQDEFSAGSMGTLTSKTNAGKTFKFIVNPDAPHNAAITFRLGFTDGTYSDFQHYQLPVNPDYINLTANNLHLTLNSKGNIGYNGYSFSQGIGISYKQSSSLIFEAGLMIASASDRISDNVRNASWQTDNDFVPVSSTRLRHNKAANQQEIRGIMRDKFPSPGQAGVEVSYKGMAWANAPNSDFVVLEYLVKNITPDTIKSLHAGIFADWNIGDPYLNVADWDDTNQMGYVYNIGYSLPYAGIKLLTNTAPSYYAIDNLGGGSGTFAIADGFSTQEKYRTLSGGIARKKAWGDGTGNDVAHVVGTSATKLAPGATQVVAFAIVAGDDLKHLRENAEAAQQQYEKIKSGPKPLVAVDTTCSGGGVKISPTGGTKFKFYEDEAKTKLLGSGASFELTALTKNTIVYVCNADSLFDSPLVPVELAVASAPKAQFSIVQAREQIQAGQHIKFKNESAHGTSWLWSFGNGDISTEKEPSYTYAIPGTYEVKLVAGSRLGCGEDAAIQQVQVLQAIPTSVEDDLETAWQLYPNPANSVLYLTLPAGASAPTLEMTDALGRRIQPKLTSLTQTQATYDLSGIADGVYIVRITHKESSLAKRVVVMRP